MNEIAQLVYDELDGYVPEALRNEVQRILNQSDLQSNAQTILNLCEVFANKIQGSVQKRKKNTQKLRFIRKSTNIDSQMETQVYIFGGQLVYTLRKFFTEEDLKFHIGIVNNGRYEKDIFLSQREVVRHFGRGGSDKEHYIGLIGDMERYLAKLQEQNKSYMSQSLVNKWKQIEELAEVRYGDLAKPYNQHQVELKKNKKTGRAIYAYQKNKADMKVYLSFTRTNNSRKAVVVRGKYYDISNGAASHLEYFNNGWLWQWYSHLTNSASPDFIQRVHTNIDQGDLSLLFGTRDNVPGVNEGDYKNAQGQQVQAKYNNEQIITYNSIFQIIQSITFYLKRYISEIQNAPKDLVQYCKDTFLPTSLKNVSEYTEFLIQENILSKLK